ncbi:MAG: sterol desaturase family protein [Pseudomonadota bacterium]
MKRGKCTAKGGSMWNELKREFERPRARRPFGSGWLSGSLSVLAGIAGLVLVAMRQFPETFTMPEFQALHEGTFLTFFLRFVLIAGYVLALLSLLLDRRKILGFTGLFLAIVASLLGTEDAQGFGEGRQALYFGLDYFVANTLFLGFLFVPLERWFPHRGEQTVFRPEWDEDLFYFLVSAMFIQGLSFLTLIPSNVINDAITLDILQGWVGAIPFAVQVVLIMLATDFIQYWLHRAFHEIPVLWRFHSIHHSAKSMDWMAGARMHFLEIAALRGFTAVPMFTLGFDLAAIQAYLLIVFVYSKFIHSNVGFDLGFIESIVVTPRFHHWHHGSDREAIDINYASHFPLYDRLFGTHHLPEERWPEDYGVLGDHVPRGFFRQLIYPFMTPKPQEPAE